MISFAGFGTNFVPASRLDALMAQLAELETDELSVINNCIELYTGTFTTDQFRNWSLGGEIGAMINRCFKYDSIEEIFDALKEETLSKNEKVISIETDFCFCKQAIKDYARSFAN